VSALIQEASVHQCPAAYNLGRVQLKQGNLDAAEKLLQRSRDAAAKHRASEHVQLADEALKELRDKRAKEERARSKRQEEADEQSDEEDADTAGTTAASGTRPARSSKQR
jgi:Tfp pilus assembly protein PilF